MYPISVESYSTLSIASISSRRPRRYLLRVCIGVRRAAKSKTTESKDWKKCIAKHCDDCEILCSREWQLKSKQQEIL